MKRRICIKDVYSEELWPGAGVVAGCSFATSVIKVFYPEALDAFDEICRKTAEEEGCECELQVYADDVTARLRGEAGQVAKLTPLLERDFDKAMETNRRQWAERQERASCQ